MEAVRKTIGKDIEPLIDVYIHLNEDLAISTAKHLESTKLYWYEEAVDPEKNAEDTKAIAGSISQGSEGGESIFRM